MQKSKMAKTVGAVERERERESYNLKKVKKIKRIEKDKTKTYEKQIGY